MPSHHGGDGGDEPPSHPPSTVPAYSESAPSSKRSQHYKSLTIFQLHNKLQGPILIQFNLEGETFYTVGEYSKHYVRHIGEYSEHYVWHIGLLIRQLIPPCYPS